MRYQAAPPEHATDSDLFAGVMRALRIVERGLCAKHIGLDMSLVTDLGIDSIRLVDLTFALQDCVGIEDFPTQQWVDDEMRKDGARFTVRSLVEHCEACLRIQRDIEEQQ